MSKSTYKDWFNVYYSQNQEDLILKSFFPNLKDGFYVDVGAQDPREFSVTKLFYDEGWSGINVEPQEKFYMRLQKDRPRDVNIRAVLGREPGKLTLREYPEASGLSTVSASMKAEYEGARSSRLSGVTEHFREYEVEARTLSGVLEEYAPDKTIQFLKIDVEGFEREVLDGNDWARFRPQVLCIESNHIYEEWRQGLKNKHYTEFLFDGLNRYYVADEVYDELSGTFDYAATALSKIPISSVPFDLLTHEIAQLNRNTKKLYDTVERQDKLLKAQQEELTQLHSRLSLRVVDKLTKRKASDKHTGTGRGGK